jgi:hypothetical protein
MTLTILFHNEFFAKNDPKWYVGYETIMQYSRVKS